MKNLDTIIQVILIIIAVGSITYLGYAIIVLNDYNTNVWEQKGYNYYEDIKEVDSEVSIKCCKNVIDSDEFTEECKIFKGGKLWAI